MMILLSNAALAYSKDGHPELPDHTAHRNNFLDTGRLRPTGVPPCLRSVRLQPGAPCLMPSLDGERASSTTQHAPHLTPRSTSKPAATSYLACCVPVSPIREHQL